LDDGFQVFTGDVEQSNTPVIGSNLTVRKKAMIWAGSGRGEMMSLVGQDAKSGAFGYGAFCAS
jgi:acyl-[acyl carrier protein]--UDP-N-acetylglucosamine O-acyltransferase